MKSTTFGQDLIGKSQVIAGDNDRQIRAQPLVVFPDLSDGDVEALANPFLDALKYFR